MEKYDEAVNLFAEVAKIFANNCANDDFDFVKIRQELIENFSQEEINYATDVIHQYAS